MKSEVKHILEAVRDGDMSIDDALLKLKTKPYEDIGFAKTDLHRKVQQGIPEVIYGAGKTARQIIGITSLSWYGNCIFCRRSIWKSMELK